MNVVDVLRINNVLYYVTNGAKWPWNEAPPKIKALYRKRSCFWASAPWCIARQYLPRSVR